MTVGDPCIEHHAGGEKAIGADEGAGEGDAEGGAEDADESADESAEGRREVD